jgi:hypothetical protein
MPKQVAIVELTPDDITWLAWAAGFAAGSGNLDAAQGIGGVLQRIQTIEMPDEQDDPRVSLELVGEAGPDAGSNEERDIDPRFMPPLGGAPQNRTSDFGAGPPPE